MLGANSDMFYVHHARQGTKDKIQQKFKVLWAKGELFCIQHTFYDPQVVKQQIHVLTGRPVTHLGSEEDWSKR